MADLSSVILDFQTGTYSVARHPSRANPYGTDGIYDAASPSTVFVRACVQPVAGTDLQRLPEGMRQRDAVTIYSVEQLFAGSPTQEADLVTIGSSVWEVQHVSDWQQLGNFYVAVAVKV